MKKILLILTLALLTMAFVGCDWFQTTTTTARPGLSNREFILEAIQKLPYQEDDTDTAYEPELSGYFLGDCQLVIYDDYSITYVLVEGSEMASIIFELDEGGSLRTGYYEVNITYQDDEREMYADVYYYWYGNIFHENYETAFVDVSVKTFISRLRTLEMEDIRWLLIQLGFNGVEVADGSEVL